jgi:hypothetical protein
VDKLDEFLVASDLDADVLEAARSLARSQGRSLGRIISDLARRGYEFWPEDVANVNHVSEIPRFPPDPSSYPLFANAIYAKVDLQAGEMLYIPGRWWHWVTSFDRNIALSMWHAADKPTAPLPVPRINMTRVDSIADPTDFRSQYFSRKEPVVIRSGHVQNWPASRKWTDDYLREASGDRMHHVEISADSQLQFTRGNHRTRLESLSVADFLERSRTSSEYHYLAQNDAIPGLLPNYWSIPDFWKECFPDDAFRAPLWFCFGRDTGVTSPLHFDYYENLLAQIAGSKTVLLFSPAQSPYLYRKEQQLLSLQKPGSAP